jgi:hypothetical protein
MLKDLKSLTTGETVEGIFLKDIDESNSLFFAQDRLTLAARHDSLRKGVEWIIQTSYDLLPIIEEMTCLPIHNEPDTWDNPNIDC